MCKNQTTTTSYSFNDYSPFPGNSSYRLKIFEKSGTITYSKIVTAHIDSDPATTLYPSPWKKGEGLFIRNPGNEKLTIQLYNETGEMITKITTVSGQVTVPPLPGINSLLRYKVIDDKDAVRGSGTLLVY
jgi:hypothetical protein